MKKSFLITFSLIWITCMGVLSGCTQEASVISHAQESDESESALPSNYYLPVGTYDSADTAILEGIDAEAQTVTLYNTYAARTYTLNYDDTTYVSDKYGTVMSMAQMTEGTIVNVNFLKSSKQLIDIQVSPDAWTYDSVTRYDLGGINSTATIGDRTYALTDGVQVFSQGKTSNIMNIVEGDVISVSGIGNDIYSIRVENGHGYVRINNDSGLIGGWIEIGSEVITRVYEDMLLAVPEGSYTVKMYNDNCTQTQDITVERNQEVVLDASDIVSPEELFGRIMFTLSPDTATLYLDGVEQDASGIVKTTYGIHQIEAEATGYNTLSKYINVGTDLAEISITLEETQSLSENSTADSTVTASVLSDNSTASSNTTAAKTTSSTSTASSSNSTSSNSSTTTTASTDNRVYIYSPTDVEVYVDGIYKGLSPLSFKKSAGSHTITLVKSGYETRSYTIYLYDDGDDISVSFSELDPVSSSDSSTSTSTTTSTSTSTSTSSTSADTDSSDTDTDTTTSDTTDSDDSETSEEEESESTTTSGNSTSSNE